MLLFSSTSTQNYYIYNTSTVDEEKGLIQTDSFFQTQISGQRGSNPLLLYSL